MTKLSVVALLVSCQVSALAAQFDKGFLNQHRFAYPSRGLEWENNQIGVSEQAPAPWSPVNVAGNIVTLTHRSLELGKRGGAALFQQITSLGQPLLADGLAVQITDDRGGVRHFTLDPKPVAATDAAATFRGEVNLAGGKATLECRIEFDGFIHLGLDFVPQTGAEIKVRDLRLTAALDRAAASHYKYLVPYNFTTEQLDDAGRIPSTGPLTQDIRLPFSPTLWLGTPQVGLEWMCETDHGWNLKHPMNAVLIQPINDRVIWSNVLINQATTFVKPAYFACAFYIMPTRPAPFPAWNADTILVNSDPVLDFKAALAPWHTFYGVHRNTSPTPGHPKARGRTLIARLRHFGMNAPFAEGPETRRYQRERNELRAQGIRYLPYSILHGLPTDLPSDEAPVDRQYLDYWDLQTSKQGHKHYFYICFQHKSAIDFQLHYALKTIREHQLDGQYFDLAQPRGAGGYARRHTSDFGAETFYMPLFGYREFSKRFYIATMQINPQFLIIQHAVIPTGISSAFAIGSGGEHLKRYFSEDGKSYTHVIAADGTTQLAADKAAYDPDYFRIPEMMYPVGNWFPVFGQNLSFSDILKGTADYYREHPDRLIYYCRTFLARSLVHGVPVWIRSLDMTETIKVFQALDRYGPRRETTSVHTARDPKIHLLNDDKTPMEYRVEQKPGRLLLFVSNSALEMQTARFDFKSLLDDAGGWTFINAETGAVIPHKNGQFEMPVTKHDFRIVIGERK